MSDIEKKEFHIGIDIGSTCTKTIVLDSAGELLYNDVRATGWSSVDTALKINEELAAKGYTKEKSYVVATGYGRVSVPFADKTVTEITCHAKGAAKLFGLDNMVIIDIGGQDTKVIRVENGAVTDFAMNDKCSAGTGRFLEVMGSTIGMNPGELCELGRQGSGVKISSMCTVFAESEIISLIGKGERRENLAFAVVESIADKVISQGSRMIKPLDTVCMTGGLCEFSYLVERLGEKLGREIRTDVMGRYAGAYGAASFMCK